MMAASEMTGPASKMVVSRIAASGRAALLTLNKLKTFC